MKKICLQAGHWNKTSGATGAPGEQELNYRIMMALKDILIAKGFQLYLVDANPPDNQIDEDFDLFLALHGDANVYGTGGGFVDHPAPEVDYAHQESKRIKEIIEGEYFQHSGIVNHPERSNSNTRYYYMWSRLTAKTPCNIIEMGVVQDAHDKVILADTPRVANAIARGICKAFDVPWEKETTTTTLPPVSPCQEYKNRIHQLELELAAFIERNEELITELDTCRQKLPNTEQLTTSTSTSTTTTIEYPSTGNTGPQNGILKQILDRIISLINRS